MSEIVGRLVLASGSPRRKEILERLGFTFRVSVSNVDETRLPGEDPATYVARMARIKAEAISPTVEADETVIASDTIVVLDGDVLGKPESASDSTAMIERLSGRMHEVQTAVAIIPARKPARSNTVLLRVVTTQVEFRALSGQEIAGYVATGEGNDKAGSYAVQGIGSGLVRMLHGNYDNVVGLPAADVIEMFRECEILRVWP